MKATAILMATISIITTVRLSGPRQHENANVDAVTRRFFRVHRSDAQLGPLPKPLPLRLTGFYQSAGGSGELLASTGRTPTPRLTKSRAVNRQHMVQIQDTKCNKQNGKEHDMYEQKISQAHPGLIGFILDDSGSMADTLPGTSDPKYQWVERYFGIILHELLARSSEVKGNEAVVKPRYYFTVVEYGSEPKLWGDPEMDIQTTVQLFSESDNSLGLGGNLGGTDAEAAFAEMLVHLKNALAGERFRSSWPPLVLHLSDGATATDATALAEEMKNQSTADGNVLLANALIGAETSLRYRDAQDFPGYLTVVEAGSSPDNVRLFEMSSLAPPSVEANLQTDGIFPQIRPGSRLFFDVRTKDMLKNVIQVVGSLGSRMAR